MGAVTQARALPRRGTHHEGGAHLGEGLSAQEGAEKEAVRPQHAPCGGERAWQVVDPVQRHARDHQVGALALERRQLVIDHTPRHLERREVVIAVHVVGLGGSGAATRRCLLGGARREEHLRAVQLQQRPHAASAAAERAPHVAGAACEVNCIRKVVVLVDVLKALHQPLRDLVAEICARHGSPRASQRHKWRRMTGQRHKGWELPHATSRSQWALAHMNIAKHEATRLHARGAAASERDRTPPSRAVASRCAPRPQCPGSLDAARCGACSRKSLCAELQRALVSRSTYHGAQYLVV